MRTTTPLCLARTAITCVAALGAGALAGCGDDEPASKPAAPAASAAPAAPASFAIEATADAPILPPGDPRLYPTPQTKGQNLLQKAKDMLT